MEKVFGHTISRDHYIAKALIIVCMDFRFTGEVWKFLNKMSFLPFDRVQVAGGIKGLVSPEKDYDAEFILRQIRGSINLHDSSIIVPMLHAGCGAYGKKFEAAKLEDDFYCGELALASKAIRDFLREERLSKPVNPIYANFSGLFRL